MPTYTESQEVEMIAEDLIKLHHPHLVDEPIRFIFRDKAAKKGGKVVLGTASLIGGRNAWFSLSEEEWDREEKRQETPSFFVIEIAQDEWGKLQPHQKQALIDHELCHCWACDTEKGKGEDKREVRTLSLKAHDIEEFSAVVQRFGFWKQDVVDFNQACHEKSTQLGLFDNTIDIRHNLEAASEPAAEEAPAEEQPVAVTTNGRKTKK